ncbi:hypothetical protein BJY04DRAFT_131780 [Aspergillus karnatakaensis]|uniref:uncharacterized protein n=1 Tax=Aspergillus karnatakaensis TaxID=1810916 RepID=UPI003CCD682D
MRHFDAWLLRDPYSIFHYYSTGHRWKETVRDLIQDRKICAPPSLSLDNASTSSPLNPYDRPPNPQAQSAFFTKLPLEIRLMIYEYAFGDEVVHLVQVKDKIRHVRCTETTSSLDKNRRCCPVTAARWRANDMPSTSPSNDISQDQIQNSSMLYPHTHPSLPSHLCTSSIPLLLTCRTIYAESSSILYKSATFDVDDLATFIAFTLSISPSHLSVIRNIAVQWTPVWQPMAGEEYKSSIFSHTHNDRLWALFWSRLGRLEGLEELSLSVDLGTIGGHTPAAGVGTGQGAGNNNNNTVINTPKLRLAITEPWVAPLLSIRGLVSFELGITAKCDANTKQAVQEGLVRDAVLLRDQLRMVMCSSRGAALPELDLPGVKELAVQVELLRRCALETEREFGRGGSGRVRPRLMITAA